MKKEYVEYLCDVCKKEVKKEQLYSYKIPVTYYYDREVTTTDITIEVCEECKQALKKAINENFAKISQVWCVGLNIEEVVYKKEKVN